eukprot:10426450-Lingulodinium_polyedra.AAC.1
MAARIAQNGVQHGFRPPTQDERARATGAAAYLRALGLSPRDFYDAIGNHFDRHVVAVRLMRQLH